MEKVIQVQLGAILEEIEGEGDVTGHDGQEEEKNQGEKLAAAGCGAGPVPSQAVPPESRGNLEAQAVGRCE